MKETYRIGEQSRNELETDGHKIILTDIEFETKNEDVWKRNLWECYLQVDDKLAWCLVSKQALKVKDFDSVILLILLKEIQKIETPA